MAEETNIPVAEEDSITDEQLASIFETDESEEVETEEGAPEKETPDGDDTPEPEKESEEDEPSGLDEDALSEWEKPEEPEPEKAALPEYLQELGKVFPNREAAGYAIDAFQRQHQFDQAVQAGNLEQAFEAMPSVKTALDRAVREHVAANEEQIVQSWIERNDPENQNPEMSRMREELSTLKKTYEDRETKECEATEQKQRAEQQQALQARQQAIDAEIPKLLDGIRFTADELNRGIVSDLIRVELSRDRDAFQKALRGDLKAIRPAAARAVKRIRSYDQMIRPPVRKTGSDTEVIDKAGVGADTEPDPFERAANWLAKNPGN